MFVVLLVHPRRVDVEEGIEVYLERASFLLSVLIVVEVFFVFSSGRTDMSVSFSVDVTELMSPSTPRTMARLERLKEHTPRRQMAEQQQLQADLLVKLNSASKKREEFTSKIQERAALEVKKSLHTLTKVRQQEHEEKEELKQRLAEAEDSAAQKKATQLQERAIKAGLTVSRAKGIALLRQQEDVEESEQQKRSIQETLAKATEHHQQQIDAIRQRAQKHVEHAKEVHDQLRWQEVEEAKHKMDRLSEALMSAEKNKNSILEEKACKAGSAYYHAKDIASCVKDLEQIEQRRLSRDLETSLRQAHSAKKDIEKQKREKLMTNSVHRVKESHFNARFMSMESSSPLSRKCDSLVKDSD